jgi:uncharacterized membrane protein YkvA (DUF1232 family)
MWSFLSLPREELQRIGKMLKNPKAPRGPKIVVALAIAYIIWPADFIPFFAMPLFGWADDLGIFGFTLWWLHKEADRLGNLK